MARFYYAVKAGRNPGIYNSWDECEKEVREFKGAIYKKFRSIEEAQDFIKEGDVSLRPNAELKDDCVCRWLILFRYKNL
jgi:ribonuclease HI